MGLRCFVADQELVNLKTTEVKKNLLKELLLEKKL